MTRARRISVWAWDLAVVVTMLAIGVPTTRAAVTVTETPNRVTLENESVRVVFDAKTNYVPTELVYKPGSGRNLIVDSFCLYYQFVQNGTIASVNEGYPGGRISNGRYKLEEKDGAASVEYRCDTPHFHMTRRVSVPATGPAVKFAYELECTQADSFSFSLPYAPLSPTLNRRATHIDFVERDGRKPGRIIVEEAKSPRLPTGVPFSQTECYFNDQTGEGLVFAHISEECSAGISQRDTPRFDAGMKERCAFVVVPFKGDHEKAMIAYLDRKNDAKPDPSNVSSAIVLKKTPGWLLWADHAARKIFPDEAIAETTPQNEESRRDRRPAAPAWTQTRNLFRR